MSAIPPVSGAPVLPAVTAPRPPAPAAAPSGAAGGAPMPSPRLRLDPELGLVVLEFRDLEGQVERTFPSKRELAAYHQGAHPPPGRPVAKDAAPTAAAQPAASSTASPRVGAS